MLAYFPTRYRLPHFGSFVPVFRFLAINRMDIVAFQNAVCWPGKDKNQVIVSYSGQLN